MTSRRASLVAAALALLLAAATAGAATSLWWDTSYARRFNVTVATGPNLPDRGYQAYTARVATLDTQSLIAAGELQPDCDDLRVLYYDGIGWQELPRHVIGCNSASTDIRFALAADIPANSSDTNYYLYYGNPSAGAPASLSPTNVYLWFDDASVDRQGDYTRGRVDAWHGTGWDNSLTWNPSGYYTYDTGDNFTSGYRRAIDERDVYVEAEFFHTGCYQLNQTTGLLVRGIIQGGSAGSERSNHYYASNRGHYPGCQANGYTHDGDIVRNQRTVTAVNGPNPPPVVPNTWRRQGVAAWLTSPTRLAFWDEDSTASWSALGWPSNANLQISGSDANDNPGRGFAAIMTAQDRARVRNVLMRRYVAPEPVLTLSAETQPPVIVLQKSVNAVYDPVNNTSNAKAIPGSWVEYTFVATNSGSGSIDSESLLVTDPLAANVELFVGDLGLPGSGPVEFTDGIGPAASGLSFTYGGLNDPGDDVEFSTDGTDWSYVPTPDGAGFDPAVRYVRINPGGSFAGASGTPTEFRLRMRVRVR